jgi:hypothetical protein
MLRHNGCDTAVTRGLESICRFTLKDYKKYDLYGVNIFEHFKLATEHFKLATKQNVRRKLESWLKNIPENDLRSVERIFIIRQEDIEALGNYTPFLYRINVVWNNPCAKWNPISWLNSFIIEHTLYHEIGHHVHRHKFGQDPEQEDEAENYPNMVFSEHSSRLVCKIGRTVVTLRTKLFPPRKNM